MSIFFEELTAEERKALYESFTQKIKSAIPECESIRFEDEILHPHMAPLEATIRVWIMDSRYTLPLEGALCHFNLAGYTNPYYTLHIDNLFEEYDRIIHISDSYEQGLKEFVRDYEERERAIKRCSDIKSELLASH